MSHKYLLVQFLNNLNDVINNPLLLTQRIKFTCFDVSSNYIIFGATSGGVYIFNRKPCTFLKLLPSKEGSIVHVAISLNEKALAVCTTKGLVLITVEPFLESNVDPLVFTEHEGNNITAILWYCNYLYCGDHMGNISMIDISNSFTKAIFKVPSSSLMQLDSGIVQLDSYSKYLLISTKTKTYLCDTVNEYYKQIGKKLRDGNFGCCFYRTKSISAVENKSISSDNEQSTDNIKIFCARPGCRLWEADFESKVLCTHQFKESLSLLQSNITSFQEFSDGRLKMSDSSDSFLEHFNFAHLYLLNNNFLITFDNNGFYIVDLTKMVLAFWNSNFKNIKNVKVFKNYIYIWTEPFKIHLISLISLEKLIMKTLHNKQFYVCSELCSMYKEDVIEILNGHENLHLLLILKEKLLEFDDVHLLDQLSSIFIKIEEQNKEKGFKLNSGIYLVSNLNTIENHSVSNKADESVLISFKEISKNLSDTFKDILHLENEMPPLNSEYEIVDPFSDNNYNLNLLYQQYKSNDVTNETFHKLLQSKNLNTLIELFSNFLEYVGSMEEEDRNNAEYWCSAQILMYFSENSNKLKMEDVDSLSFKYLKNAFEYINDGRIEICSCSYPLPSAKCNVPQYSEIGREILSKLWHSNKDTTNLLNRVPYLWKDFLKLKRNENIDLLLPVIMQYSDEELLTYFNRKLTYDNWDTATQLLIKLKKSNCLYCDKRFQCADRTVSWTNFAVVIVQNIGSFGALRILSNYADLIPSRELGVKFYQTCIFTTAVNKHDGVIQSETAAFMQDMHNDSSSFKEISNSISKYLTKKYMASASTNIEKAEEALNFHNKCNYCNLPLNCPILEDDKKLNCGHAYHNICIRHLNNICNQCGPP